MDLTFNVLSGCNNITFQVVFGSEEFTHYLGLPQQDSRAFPDAFGAFLNGNNVALVDAYGPSAGPPDQAYGSACRRLKHPTLINL